MLSENALRRAEFTAGMTIRLADGQPWAFPALAEGPPAAGDGPPGDGPEYGELLAAVRESEDLAELRLAELALGIYLLERNYRLTTDQLRMLFEFRPGDPAEAEAQQGFRELAARALRRAARPHETRRGAWRPAGGRLAPLVARLLGGRSTTGRAGILGGESRP